MNKTLKMQVKAAFQIPLPTRKYEFLDNYNFPKARYRDFVISQIGYIRKRNWLISLSLIISAFFYLRYEYIENLTSILWVISSVFPFIALIAILEISRSTSYRMSELEMSCKHSLSDIVLVRLGMLGVFNIAIIIVLIFLLNKWSDYGIWRIGLYISVPFLLTCALSLIILNHVKVRETSYICGGTSGLVSLINSVFVYQTKSLLNEQYLILWGIVVFILFIVLIMQVIKLLKNVEELQWSLQLTV